MEELQALYSNQPPGGTQEPLASLLGSGHDHINYPLAAVKLELGITKTTRIHVPFIQCLSNTPLSTFHAICIERHRLHTTNSVAVAKQHSLATSRNICDHVEFAQKHIIESYNRKNNNQLSFSGTYLSVRLGEAASPTAL